MENLKESLRFCHNDTQYGNLLFYSKSESIPISDGDDDDGDGEGEGDDDQVQADNGEVLIDDSEITSLSLSNQMDQLSLRHHQTSMSLSDSISKDTPLPVVTDTNFKYDTRLTVIDFEYAGQNPPAYDITNHFSEWMYDYHDPQYNYKTDETKYPTVEERINYLNSYAHYVPGSSTPNLKPISSSSSAFSLSTPTGTSSTFSKHPSVASPAPAPAPAPPLKPSRSVVSIKLADLPPSVTHLYNETIYWRSTSSIFWALWAIISRGSIDTANSENTNSNSNSNTNKGNNLDFKTPKFEIGPNGEQYKIIIDENETMNENESGSDDEFLKPTLDDEFDHQKYALGKIGIFIGDMIQFGLLKKEAIDTDRLKDVKFLDTELLPLTDS